MRRATLNHELVAGAGRREFGSLYLLASRPLGSGTFAPSVRIVDVTAFAEVGSIPLPTTSIPSAIAIAPNGRFLYVAGALTATVFTDPRGVALHIIDTGTRTIVKTLTFTGDVGITAPVLKVTKDSRLVFLTTSAGISVIDTLSQSLSHTVPISSFGNLQFTVDRSSTRLYVAPVFSRGSGGVAEYDIATSQLLRHFPVTDRSTLRIALSSDDERLYLSQIPLDPATQTNGYPELLVLELETGQVVDRMPYPEPQTAPVTLRSMVAVPLTQ